MSRSTQSKNRDTHVAAQGRSEADIVDEAAKNGEYRAPGTPEASAAYCPGCGRSEYAGITHVCPPPEVSSEPPGVTHTASTIPVFSRLEGESVSSGFYIGSDIGFAGQRVSQTGNFSQWVG